MHYLGGKTRTAPRIAGHITELATPGATYWEPFIGGANVAAAVSKSRSFNHLQLSDIHADLVQMWDRATHHNWVPPASIDRAEWERLRDGPECPERTFAGFGASFRGKWWGGHYTDDGESDVNTNQRGVIRKARHMRMTPATFTTRAYHECEPSPGDVVYCDPPYAGTTGYDATDPFDHQRFWSWCETMSKWGVHVLVSEFTAPETWAPVFTVEHTSTVDVSSAKRDVESLYYLRGSETEDALFAHRLFNPNT